MSEGFYYLATVYTKHPDGLHAAFEEAARLTAGFLNAGIPVFCPITHSHPIAEHGKLDAVDHEFWMRVDRPFMDAAKGLIVCRMPGWQESRGIAEEIETFRAAGKPVLFYDP